MPKASKPITQDTIIGIEYRTYKEKKEFLQSIIGKQFHFTVHLLYWFKEYSGKKNYRDYINEWYKEQELKKSSNYKKKIEPQFEYNTYMRNFLNDNPDKSKSDAIKYWKIKKSTRGDNTYKRTDLKN